MASTETQAADMKKHAKMSNSKLKTGDSGPMLALEPRILLDAALADTAAKVADAVVHQSDGTAHVEAKTAGKDMLLALAPMGRDQARREVIFVDAGAENIKELLGKATPERQVVVLNPNRDGVQQITRVLGRMGKVDAVHIFSHGEGGKIQLGKGELSLDNISKYQKQLKSWASHLSNAADILIYGCNVAEGAKGADFVRLLAELTQADVAASTDLTGASDQGGDWDLEKVVGNIETDLALSVHGREEYHDTLAVGYDRAVFGASRLKFSGTNFVDVGNTGNVLLDNTKNMAIEAWIKPNAGTSGSFMSIVDGFDSASAAPGGEPGGLAIFGNKVVFIQQQTGSIFDWMQSTLNVPTDGNTWTHVAATWDATTFELKFYVNGQLDTGTYTHHTKNYTPLAGNKINVGQNSSVLHIGTRGLFGGQGFQGQIDDVRIYQGTLPTISTTTVNAPIASPGTETGLVGYWQFNEASTAPSATANTGSVGGSDTLTGSPSWIIDDAPTLTTSASPTITIDEAATTATPTLSTQGVAISSLIDSGGTLNNYTDYDLNTSNPFPGIAITGINEASKGTLYYYTQATNSWQTITSATVSASSALLLDSNDRIYFKEADANVNGNITNAITFKAWDGGPIAAGNTTYISGFTNADTTATPATGVPFSSASDTIQVTINALNDAPIFTNLGNSISTTTGTAVTLDSTVTIADADLDALASGSGNYTGTTLTIARSSGANPNDTFAADGVNVTWTSSIIRIGATRVGLVTTNSGGTLTLTFDSSAVTADVNTVMKNIKYTNSTVENATLTWTFDDQNSNAVHGGSGIDQGGGSASSTVTGTTTITVTSGSDTTAPTISTPASSIATTLEDTPTTSGTDITFATLKTNTSATDDTAVTAFVVQSVDSGTLSIGGLAYNASTNNTITSSSAVVWTPAANANGTGTSALNAFTVKAKDAAGNLSATSQIKMDVTPVNDQPTLTASAATGNFTEGGSPVSLFTSASSNTNDSNDAVKAITMTLTNVTDGSSEILNIDGTAVALTNGNSVSTLTNGMTASVSLSGSTATITISKTAGITATAANTLINGITYQNDSQNPTAASRVASLTKIQDTGGTANSGVDLKTLTGISKTTTVTAVNDAPTLTNNGITAAGGSTPAAHPITASELTASDVDNTDSQLTYTVTTLPTKGTLKLNGTPISTNGTFTQADLAAGNVTYTANVGQTGSDSFAFDVKDPSGAGPTAQTANITLTSDTVPPTRPTVNPLSVNSASPTITGTFDAADHAGGFTVTVGGTTYTLGTDAALTSNGNTWSLDLAAAGQTLADGAYNVVATATDADNNAASDSSTNELTIDTTNPATPAITGPAEGATLTSTTTTVTGTGEANATIEVFDTDGTSLGTTTVDSAGNWSLAGVTLALGDHTLHAKQTDAAGNVSPEQTVSFTIEGSSASTLDIASGGIFDVQTVAKINAIPTSKGSTSSLGVETGGTPVIDTVQQSAALSTLDGNAISTLNTPVNTSSLPDPAQAATSSVQGFDVNALSPSGAGNEKPTAGQAAAKQTAAQTTARAAIDSARNINVDTALQNQINQLSPDSFFVKFPGLDTIIGDVIYSATRLDGSKLPDYVKIDPETGKITIDRKLAPLGVSDIAIKVSRIVQNGDLKDVKSTSIKITIDKEAKVKLGNENSTPRTKGGA